MSDTEGTPPSGDSSSNSNSGNPLIVLGSPSEDFLKFPQSLLNGLGEIQYHFYKSIDETFEGKPSKEPEICLVDGRSGTNVAAEWSQSLRMAHPQSEIWVLYGAENPLDTNILKKNGARQVFHLLYDAEFFISEAISLLSERMSLTDPPLKSLTAVSSEDFDPEMEINFDVYIHIASSNKSILVRKKGATLDQRIQENSKKSGQALLVKKSELKNFFEYARTVRTARNDETPVALTETLFKTKKRFYSMISTLLDAGASDFQSGKEVLNLAEGILVDLEIPKMETPDKAFEIMKKFTGQPRSPYQDALNTCVYATGLSVIMGLKKEEKEALTLAGLFCNLGLSQLPLDTFGKKFEDYTDSEKDSFKHYPEKSVNLVKSKKVALNNACTQAILDHAEKADGTGFPKGRLADDTDPLGKILHLACRLNELTSAGPGHPPLSIPQTVDFLREETFKGKAQHDMITMTRFFESWKKVSH